MVQVLGTELPFEAPKFGIGIGSWTILLICIIVITLILGGIGIWLITRWRLFNKKIVVFENIAGRGFQPVYKDRARLVKIGNSGEELLFLRKKKIYRSAYGKKMGKNTYWFAIGQDGYWYNIVLGDVDAKLGMLDIEPTNPSARFEFVAMSQNIEKNYTKKPTIMDKYGQIIISGIFLIIIIVGMIVMLNKFGEITSALAGNLESAKLVQESSRQIISSLDNICSKGGGMIPVG